MYIDNNDLQLFCFKFDPKSIKIDKFWGFLTEKALILSMVDNFFLKKEEKYLVKMFVADFFIYFFMFSLNIPQNNKSLSKIFKFLPEIYVYVKNFYKFLDRFKRNINSLSTFSCLFVQK